MPARHDVFAELPWLNAARPFAIERLPAVLLVFLAVREPSSRHVLPLVHTLLRRYRRDGLVIIGVQRAAELTHLADILLQDDIDFPVVVDTRGEIAARYGVYATPTAVLLTRGELTATIVGEPEIDVVTQVVGSRIEPVAALVPEVTPAVEDTRFLRYPTHVAVSPNGRIAISDTGHHRVLVAEPLGRVVHVVGRAARHQDGPWKHAHFAGPCGLAWDDEVVWVADEGRHTLTRVDLLARNVTTVAGTGKLGREHVQTSGDARSIALRSPRAVSVHDTDLILALAGGHELVRYTKHDQRLERLAGTGVAATLDAPASRACLDTPCALAADETRLFIGELNGAVRKLEHGVIATVAAPGTFGLPSAMVRVPGGLLVADADADAIMKLDVKTGVATRFDASELLRPSGLALFANGDVLVADTGHHRLLRLSESGLLLEETRLLPPVG